MSLSVFCKKVIRAGLANRVAGNELIAAVDGLGGAVQGAAVASIGALATVTAPLGAVTDVGVGVVDVACALAVDVDTNFEAVSDKIDLLIAGADARILTLQAKVDALILSLRTAALIDT